MKSIVNDAEFIVVEAENHFSSFAFSPPLHGRYCDESKQCAWVRWERWAAYVACTPWAAKLIGKFTLISKPMRHFSSMKGIVYEVIQRRLPINSAIVNQTDVVSGNFGILDIYNQ